MTTQLVNDLFHLPVDRLLTFLDDSWKGVAPQTAVFLDRSESRRHLEAVQEP